MRIIDADDLYRKVVGYNGGAVDKVVAQRLIEQQPTVQRNSTQSNASNTLNALDTIYRQVAIDAIYEAFCYAYCDNCEKNLDEDLCGDCHRKYQNWSASKKTIEKVINALPSAQSERKKGKWDFMGWQMFQCSECKHTFTQDFLEGWREYTYESHFPPFCPNCGCVYED